MDITDDQAREALWASSEDGIAQLAAAWGRAQQLGLDDWGLTRDDLGALLWAAHETKPPEPPENPRKRLMLELITARGEAGMTVREAAIALYAETREDVSREALYRWVVQYADAGLLEQFDGRAKGMWRAVRR